MVVLRVDDVGDRRYIASVKLPQSVLAQLHADAKVSIEFGPDSVATLLHVDGQTFQLKSQPEEQLLLDCLGQQGSGALNFGPVLDKITVPKTSEDTMRKRADASQPARASAGLALDRSDPVDAQPLAPRRGPGRPPISRGRGRGQGRARGGSHAAGEAQQQQCRSPQYSAPVNRVHERERGWGGMET